MTDTTETTTDSTERPFKQTRTQEQWNFECVESAAFTFLPACQPSQTDPVVVPWQKIQQEAQTFTGYTGDGALVRELLEGDKLDIIVSEPTAGGYKISPAIGPDTGKSKKS